jgi:hypothetical protein
LAKQYKPVREPGSSQFWTGCFPGLLFPGDKEGSDQRSFN